METTMIQIRWKRGKDEIDYDSPSIYFSLGTRGSGKSSFLEAVGEEHLQRGHTILDLFGSRDGEALAWLRSPWAEKKQILLLKGENVDVSAGFPVKNAQKLQLSDFEKYDIIISASPFYSKIDQEFVDAAKIEDVLYKRLHYKKVVYLCCREASNFYYSRLKVSDNQLFAKTQMIYLIRESRHMGISMGLDSIRSYAIDIDIRSLSDYLILKAQGVQGLSRELKWLYRFIEAKTLRVLPPNKFFMVSKNGAIGYGKFDEILWHKQAREDILANLGITIEAGEPCQEALMRGTYKTVADREHAEIIRVYVEESLNMIQIADKLKRSPRTINLHIIEHNRMLKSIGNCPRCRRAQSIHADKEAIRT